MSKSKCCEVITGKGQRCIQEGKYAKEGHLVCGLHQFTKRPIKYIPCKSSDVVGEEEKVDIVTKILEKRFHSPIDIPCVYCEAAKEIVNLISPTLPSQEKLENCGTECYSYKDCQVWHGNPTIKHLCPLIKSLPSQELLLTELREELAEVEHDQWMRWAKNLTTELMVLTAKHPTVGCPCKTCSRIDRWERLFCHYGELTEEQKDQDRKEADIVLAKVVAWRGK